MKKVLFGSIMVFSLLILGGCENGNLLESSENKNSLETGNIFSGEASTGENQDFTGSVEILHDSNKRKIISTSLECDISKLESTEIINIDDVVQNCKKERYFLYLDPPLSFSLAKYNDLSGMINGMFLVKNKYGDFSIQYIVNTYVYKKGIPLSLLDCKYIWNEKNASLPGGQFWPPLKLMQDLTVFVNRRKTDIQGRINQLGVDSFASCPYNYYENSSHENGGKISRHYGGFLEKANHYFILGARNENLRYDSCPPEYFLIDGKLYYPGENDIVDIGYGLYTKKGRWIFSDFMENVAIVKRRKIINTFSGFTVQNLEKNLPIGYQYIETCEIPLTKKKIPLKFSRVSLHQ